MNQFSIKHSFPGICAKCFTEVAEFKGSTKEGKPIIKRFLPNFVAVDFLLSDKSQMTITLCLECANDIGEKDYLDLMVSECGGWEWEINTLLKQWTEQQKSDYLTRYKKLSITGHIHPSLRGN